MPYGYGFALFLCLVNSLSLGGGTDFYFPHTSYPTPRTLSDAKAFLSPHELKAFIQTSMGQKSQEETGLGLAITHRLERLEGKMSLFSDAF